MSDVDEFDEFPAPDEGEDQFKAMRARANKAARLEKQAAELAAENSRLTREIAFTSAGLSLDERKQAALLAAHGENPMTADALRATAVELGFAQPVADPQAAAQQAALAGQQQIAQAQAGSTVPDLVPNIDQQILAAEQAGDTKALMRLKAAAYLAQMEQRGHATVT